MSDRPKLPPYIKVINIIMIVIILAICGLAFALTWTSKDLGWALPTTSDGASADSPEITGQTAEVTVQTAE